MSSLYVRPDSDKSSVTCQRAHRRRAHARVYSQGGGTVVGANHTLGSQYCYRLLFTVAQALKWQLMKAQAQPQAHSCGPGPLALTWAAVVLRQLLNIGGGSIPILSLILYIHTVLEIEARLSSVRLFSGSIECVAGCPGR